MEVILFPGFWGRRVEGKGQRRLVEYSRFGLIPPDWI